MKKVLIVICLTLTLTFRVSFYTFAAQISSNLQTTYRNQYIPPKHSTEELYQDIFMTLLLPHIQRAVDNYYKNFLTVSPSVGLYNITVLSATREGEYRTFDFLLKLELHPYVGPHLGVGLDNITLRVNPVNNVTIEKYEHIKSYDLPKNYQNIIKKKLP